MEGGGSSINLSNIGDYRNIDDVYTILNSSLFTLTLSLLATRIGNLGGFSLNTYFDIFGIEGVLSNTMLITLMFQITRYFYTVLYANFDKSWSPFVFICGLLGVQIVHDVVFYYGVINFLPSGKNDMIDVLKQYSKENSTGAIGGHSAVLILTALVAMITNDMDMVSKFVLLGLVLYSLPYIISIVHKKPAPPPPPPAKKEEIRDVRGFY
uniref:Uncharacterized protein n=1 Tax=viral metagenome TaxID=1070528 RepID=A0A6C0K0I0_9ZZZZ